MKLPNLKLRHLGIFVSDIVGMSEFYKNVLGFIETDRGEVRGGQVVFLTRDVLSHHQLVMETGRPLGAGPGLGIQQISFQVETLNDLRLMNEIVCNRNDVSLIQSVDHGNSWSLYFRDPELNRIEVYLDTPWHISQPYLEPLDLSMNDELIHEITLEKISKLGEVISLKEWSQQLAKDNALR
jgi:catechol 2,3-dioxygenase-like lactoylglutathione lyase family enzyme